MLADFKPKPPTLCTQTNNGPIKLYDTARHKSINKIYRFCHIFSAVAFCCRCDAMVQLQLKAIWIENVYCTFFLCVFVHIGTSLLFYSLFFVVVSFSIPCFGRSPSTICRYFYGIYFSCVMCINSLSASRIWAKGRIGVDYGEWYLVRVRRVTFPLDRPS